MQEPEQWLKFTNASGGKMGHYGAKEAMFMTGEKKDKVMKLGFQISDVQKPLAAVWRIAEKGNLVQFGPKAEFHYECEDKGDCAYGKVGGVLRPGCRVPH